MNSNEICIGFSQGMLCIGEKVNDKMKNILLFVFDKDANGKLNINLQNPLPFSFNKKGTEELFRMEMDISSFAFIFSLDEVEDPEGIKEYYFEILSEETEFHRQINEKRKEEINSNGE